MTTATLPPPADQPSCSPPSELSSAAAGDTSEQIWHPSPSGGRSAGDEQLALDGTGQRSTRAQRAAQPMAADVLRQVAIEHGACVRPIQMRRTDTTTGAEDHIMVPCGATTEDKCPSCAKRAQVLRAAQCREGWHLDTEPVLGPAAANADQKYWMQWRADLQAGRDRAAATGQDTAEWDANITAVDAEIIRAGVRGTTLPRQATRRRRRSTRRRQDAPNLPKRKMSPRTLGKTYTSREGKTFRPSMFLTLTCPSYGPVHAHYHGGRPCRCGHHHRADAPILGTPVDAASYDYRRAARDVIHFPALFDRFIQNVRRVEGYDVQYFATVEPQRRLSPHVHTAMRGTIPRTDIRLILQATYHQVWWPPTDTVIFDGDHLPVWDQASGRYVDPATGEVLPTWDQALDAIGPNDAPYHLARFGDTFDAQGVIAGSPDTAKRIGYLTKYLTKHVADCHAVASDEQAAHADRLVEALAYEPCCPTCTNWLRYGVQPKDAKAGLVPGRCKGKAHRRAHLGFAGRRVFASRKWTGKTLADHRGERQAWLLRSLNLSATPITAYTWAVVKPDDDDFMPPRRRLLHAVADRARWRTALEEAHRLAGLHDDNELSATGRAA